MEPADIDKPPGGLFEPNWAPPPLIEEGLLFALAGWLFGWLLNVVGLPDGL